MPSGQSTLLFDVPTRGVKRTELRDFARRLQLETAHGQPFTCLVTSDGALRELNLRFRKKDEPTDVLSFPAGGLDDSLGEIAISFHRAKAQAEEYGHSPSDEIRILILHGVLHLMGMDHEADQGEMARAERRWRKHYNLPLGLIERVEEAPVESV